jgi:hypothetical protein
MAHISTKSLLETAAPRFFVAVLRPFREACSRFGVPLDVAAAARDPQVFVDALHRLLSSDDPAIQPIEATLARIAHLADDEGFERLSAVLEERRACRASSRRRLTPLELALEVYESSNEVFELAYARKQLEATQAFWEWFPGVFRPLVGHRTAEVKQLLRTRLGAFYLAAGKTGFSDVDVSETDRELRILSLHGRTPRAHGVIDEEELRHHLRYVPDRYDLVRIDKATGRLSVHAQFRREVQFLRRVTGEVLYGDPEHFSRGDLYTGHPLLEQGLAALDPQGIEGIRHVVLRKLRLCTARGTRVTFEGDDLATELRDERHRSTLRGARVLEVKLGVVSGRSGVMRRLAIEPPNKITFDVRRGDDGAMRAFLVARGFASYPCEWSLAMEAA